MRLVCGWLTEGSDTLESEGSSASWRRRVLRLPFLARLVICRTGLWRRKSGYERTYHGGRPGQLVTHCDIIIKC